MTARDRLVLIVIAAVLAIGAGYMLKVKPAREQASAVGGEVSTARSQLSTVQGEIANAQSAKQRYRSAYAALATLGIAVPTSSEVPALLYTIDQASNRQKVKFISVSSGGGSGTSGASLHGSAGVKTTGLTQTPFAFTFNGSYKDLIDLLKQLEGFTTEGPSGTLQVSGRLLTIQSIGFGVAASGSAGASPQGGSSSGTHPGEMTWTISATAYVLPASEVAAPSASGGTSGGTQSASGTGSGGTAAATPAVVRATP